MKKIITLLAVAVTSLAALTPSTTQAYDGHGHSSRSYSHSCGSCRAPIYRERVVIGRDRHGCLQYGYRTVSHSCRSSHGHGHDYGHSSHGRGHSSHGHGSSRGGVFFGFGR
ncbi:MAG: hypothetical protein V4662_17000 [Verrucomicrobiota bacterium]